MENNQPIDIDNIFLSFEVSKILKEIGVPQISNFYWNIYEYEMTGTDEEYDKLYDDPSACDDDLKLERLKNDENSVSAFTSEELSKFLPKYINYEILEWHGWRVSYKLKNGNTGASSRLNLVAAMAEILIYLIEQKLINIK